MAIYITCIETTAVGGQKNKDLNVRPPDFKSGALFTCLLKANCLKLILLMCMHAHQTNSRCSLSIRSISARLALSIVFSFSCLYLVQSVHLVKRFSCGSK